MKNQSYQIKECINPEIQPGDIVKLHDGSGLTTDRTDEAVYIIFAYPFLNSNKILKELPAVVLQTGIKDYVTMKGIGIIGKGYLQDILIEINGVKFRTCSQLVTKLIPG